jgi:hypothetical protein
MAYRPGATCVVVTPERWQQIKVVLVRARLPLVNTSRGLAKSYGERLRGCNVGNIESGKIRRLKSRVAKRTLAAAGRNRSIERSDLRAQGAHREAGPGALSADGAAQTL